MYTSLLLLLSIEMVWYENIVNFLNPHRLTILWDLSYEIYIAMHIKEKGILALHRTQN